MSKRGRPADEEVLRAYKRYWREDKDSDWSKCLGCGREQSWNTTALAEHLLDCDSYKKQLEEREKSQSKRKQATINFHAITPSWMLHIQKSLAFACYMDGLPFNAYDLKNKHLPHAILLIYSGIKFPSIKRIATKLLDGKNLLCTE